MAQSQDIDNREGMRIELPWPPLELSPNFRQGWRSKHDPKKKYKNDCYLVALSTKTVLGKTFNVPLQITFHPKTKKTPDLDNCLSWIKHGLDGVALAWGINDRQFRPITIDMGEPVTHGKVVVQA